MADNQSPDLFGPTPSQTVGPYFHYSLPWRGGADLIGRSDLGARPDLFPADHDILNTSPTKGPVSGPAIEITGRVLDADGVAVADALIEIWQADAEGRYASPADPRAPSAAAQDFTGFGRGATDAEGVYRFRTIRPGRTPGSGDSLQAAHIAIGVLGRGLLKRLVTRLYFDDGEGHDDDEILALVPAARRHTLIARRRGEATWVFDIVLQGEAETVFFDI